MIHQAKYNWQFQFVFSFSVIFVILVRTLALLSIGRRNHSLSKKENTRSFTNFSVTKHRPKIVIIGGGWAGYSFAESIVENDADVILLDTAAKGSSGGGLAGGFRTPENGRPVEAGIHGFWREYKNVFHMMEHNIGLDLDSILGDFTPSALYSKNGKVAVAPVLASKESEKHWNTKNEFAGISKIQTILSQQKLLEMVSSYLPPPLDVALLTEFQRNSKLTIIDRISAIGLLGAWADFEQESSRSWKRYDSITAYEMFQDAGVTDGLYEELIAPLLHVLPMCPAYDCSAAAALSCFHVFALQSKGAFDVRWAKGNLSELIFQPWQNRLKSRKVDFRFGERVSSIEPKKFNSKIDKQHKFQVMLESGSYIDCDAVIFAVGCVSIGKLAKTSPILSSLSQDFTKLRGITCVAVRLFLKVYSYTTFGLKGGNYDSTNIDPSIANAMLSSPIAVCGPGMGNIPELEETGFCIYDLQRMHDEFSTEKCSDVSVIEVDFFRADSIAVLDDPSIASLTLRAISAALQIPCISTDQILDFSIVRAKDAVSHFCPGSESNSPPVKLDDGLYICGDWVNRSGHASWSTEKSVVTAKQAAISLSQDMGWSSSRISIFSAAKDSCELSSLRRLARTLRALVPLEGMIPKAPWVIAKELYHKTLQEECRM